jgi:hypothetical protein
MHRTTIIKLLLIATFQLSNANQINQPEFQIAYSSEEDLEDRKDLIEDSLEEVEEMREDSIERVEEREDDIQDSIQEYRIGMEGRRLRFSIINYFAINKGHLVILPEYCLVDRIAFIEFGFNGISFNQGDKNGKHHFLSFAPVAGVVPFLSRPVRTSFGAGMAMQFETSNHMSTSYAPFLYMTGTVFYAKRVSSSITARYLHSVEGGYCYWGSFYNPKKQGDSWVDIGLSVDFYF